jgi:hypothetical protein
VASWKGHHREWPRADTCALSRQGSGRRLLQRLSSSEGTYSMIYDLLLPVTAPALGIAALAVVYVLSNDPDRRGRALKLLKLLLRR